VKQAYYVTLIGSHTQSTKLLLQMTLRDLQSSLHYVNLSTANIFKIQQIHVLSTKLIYVQKSRNLYIISTVSLWMSAQGHSRSTQKTRRKCYLKCY